MPDRIELLTKAENEEMKYNNFLDYVINYIYSYNEEKGEEVYTFYLNRNYVNYIKYNKYEA